MINTTLLEAIKAEFKIDWWGHHGIRHWARVRRNGRVIAKHVPGVDLLVLDLFAILHDSCRINEHEDPEHGWRAKVSLIRRSSKLPRLAATQLASLKYAIEHHSEQAPASNVTIAACWNADRYDLGRVGITPDDRHLAKEALLPKHLWWPLHQSAVDERTNQRTLHA